MPASVLCTNRFHNALYAHLYILTATMDKKRNILGLEACLGFKFPTGLEPSNRLRGVPVLDDLLSLIRTIKRRYVQMTASDIRQSTKLREEAYSLFHALGSRLWPDAGQDRSDWLAEAGYSDSGGQYPCDLFFSVADHRKKYISG